MKFYITGSRSFNDEEAFNNTVDFFKDKIDLITIEGTLDVNDLVLAWAKKNGVPVLIEHPKWNVGGQHDKGAGFRKTNAIVKGCDAVIAFWDQESKGTKMVLEKAVSFGKKIKVYKYEDPFSKYFIFVNKSSFLHPEFPCKVFDSKGNTYESADQAYNSLKPSEDDLNLMLHIQKAKFKQHTKLKEKLKELNGKTIVFDSDSHPWGANVTEGGLDAINDKNNMMGKILTQIKNELNG